MKQHKKTYRFVPLILALCVLVGIAPVVAATEAKIAPITWDLTFDNVNNDEWWNNFAQSFADHVGPAAIEITVKGRVPLRAPLRNSNGASVRIKGIPGALGEDPTLYPSPDTDFTGKYLFTFENGGYAAHLDVRNVTLDGGKAAGLVCVLNYGTVHFGSDENETTPARFINASTTEEQGSAIKLSNIPYASIQGCTFESNVGSMSSSSTGCLYYFAPRYEPAVKPQYNGLYIRGCKFANNRSHSGGAMYVFGRKSYVYIDRYTTFENNYAGQRGGAIHCHGTVFVDGARFTDNHCDGLGGAIYVSASQGQNGSGVTENFYGTLVLNGWPSEGGMVMKNNVAGTTGGAVYVARDGVVILMGDLKIKDNYLGTYGQGIDYATSPEHRKSNIYTVGADGHIVVTPTLAQYTGKGMIGISTSSPTIGMNIIVSPMNLTEEYARGG